MTLFRFLIKLKWSHCGGPESKMTGVLIKEKQGGLGDRITHWVNAPGTWIEPSTSHRERSGTNMSFAALPLQSWTSSLQNCETTQFVIQSSGSPSKVQQREGGSNDSSLKTRRLFSKKEGPWYIYSRFMLLIRQELRTSKVLKCHLKSIKKKSKSYKGGGYTRRALGRVCSWFDELLAKWYC